jgi:hypothetical protein
MITISCVGNLIVKKPIEPTNYGFAKLTPMLNQTENYQRTKKSMNMSEGKKTVDNA